MQNKKKASLRVLTTATSFAVHVSLPRHRERIRHDGVDILAWSGKANMFDMFPTLTLPTPFTRRRWPFGSSTQLELYLQRACMSTPRYMRARSDAQDVAAQSGTGEVIESPLRLVSLLYHCSILRLSHSRPEVTRVPSDRNGSIDTERHLPILPPQRLRSWVERRRTSCRIPDKSRNPWYRLFRARSRLRR